MAGIAPWQWPRSSSSGHSLRSSACSGPPPKAERWTIGIFGIRGIGSIYYVAYALGEADFPEAGNVWSTLAFVIVCSIVVHGIAATPVMRRLDRRVG